MVMVCLTIKDFIRPPIAPQPVHTLIVRLFLLKGDCLWTSNPLAVCRNRGPTLRLLALKLSLNTFRQAVRLITCRPLRLFVMANASCKIIKGTAAPGTSGMSHFNLPRENSGTQIPTQCDFC